MVEKYQNNNQISIWNDSDSIMRELLKLLSVSDISLELRTPLTAIKGFVELLLNSNDLNLAQRQNLQIILRNEARLESVIQKIEGLLGEFRKKSRIK
jgi:signal transduction histidine kinase